MGLGGIKMMSCLQSLGSHEVYSEQLAKLGLADRKREPKHECTPGKDMVSPDGPRETPGRIEEASVY